MLAVARGDQPLMPLEWGLSDATERGEGSAVGASFWLTALLHNGHGQYGEALYRESIEPSRAAARWSNSHAATCCTASGCVVRTAA